MKFILLYNKITAIVHHYMYKTKWLPTFLAHMSTHLTSKLNILPTSRDKSDLETSRDKKQRFRRNLQQNDGLSGDLV